MAKARGSHSVLIGFVLSCSLAAMGQEFAGGTGAPGDPYQIATAEQLLGIGGDPNLLDKHFVLIADINLSGYLFDRAPIAPHTESSSWVFRGPPFAGVFAGNGHVIRNLRVEGELYVGLFGYLVDSAVVSDLGVENGSIQGQYFVGALAGTNEGAVSNCYSTGEVTGGEFVGGLIGHNCGWHPQFDLYGQARLCDSFSTAKVHGLSYPTGGLVGANSGIVWNCHSTGEVVGGLGSTGGLAGSNSEGIVSHCFSTGAVAGENHVGGLVGSNSEGVVSSCYSAGPVTGTSSGVYSDGVLTGASQGIGGLIGYSHDDHVSNCFSTGAVGGFYKVGGLIGSASGSIVRNCYSLGTVTGAVRLGGLIGDGSTDWTSAFWNIETSGLTTSRGGVGLTTAEMQDIETYLNAGWDFAGEGANGTAQTWQMAQDTGYPRLSVFEGQEPVRPPGQGTLDDPFLITNAVELGSIGYRPLASYRLTSEIDLSGITWSVAPIPWFGGHFDGNGGVISHLQIEGEGPSGLFGCLGYGASVSELGLKKVAIEDRIEEAGSLAGVNHGTLTACYCEGSAWHLGFISTLVGHNYGSVADCYSIGNLTTGFRRRNDPVGPKGRLVARNNGTISTSYWRGTTGGELWFDGILVTGLTTAEMQDIDTFLDAGWDFVDERHNGMEDIWMICQGQDSPRLQWQNIICDE